MLDEIIKTFGFEDERVIEFATIIEESDEFDEIDRDYVMMWFSGFSFKP